MVWLVALVAVASIGNWLVANESFDVVDAAGRAAPAVGSTLAPVDKAPKPKGVASANAAGNGTERDANKMPQLARTKAAALPASTILTPGEAAGYYAFQPPDRKRLILDRAWLVELGIVLVGMFIFAITSSGQEVRRRLSSPTEAVLFGTQVFVVAVGVLGGIAHILWSTKSSSSFTPSIDTVALGYFAFALIGALLPRLQKFGIAGASFEMTVEKATAVTTEVAQLLDDWISALNIFLVQVAADENPAATIEDFLADRSDEAAGAISAIGEVVRISFWNYVPEEAALELLQSSRIVDEATTTFKFPLGKGCLGRAFRERQPWNEADPRALSSWIDIPGSERGWNGMLLIPISWDNTTIGMLAIDREAKERFGPTAVQIASALASLAGNALGSPITKQALERAASNQAPRIVALPP